jgi:ribosomal protein L24
MKTIKLKDIISISGKGGLYMYIAQARNGIVVESIEDKKRHVAPATPRVSSLEDIAIFTHEEEVPLSDIFMMILEKTDGKETISHKSAPEQLKAYFQELVPDYDDGRVYLSDIKKVVQWYNQLHGHNLLEVIDKEEEKETEGEKPADSASKEIPPAKAKPAVKGETAVKPKPGAIAGSVAKSSAGVRSKQLGSTRAAGGKKPAAK